MVIVIVFIEDESPLICKIIVADPPTMPAPSIKVAASGDLKNMSFLDVGGGAKLWISTCDGK